jgi:hypothetical protein
MQDQDSDEKSPFTKYREGYEDGYNGRTILMPDDADYIVGYNTGKEDDRYGMPCKYSEE